MPTRIQRRPPKLRALSRAAGHEPARPAELRETNCRTLLRLLRAHSPCSRADLVRLSGLTAPTVAMGAAQLIERGLAEAIGDGESSGGRRPALLRFNASHGYVAGADIGGTRLRMVLADLSGHQVARWSIEMNAAQKSPRAVVSLLSCGLAAMTAQEPGASGRVLHLTAGAPGITDVDRGVVLAAPNLLGWNDVSLRTMLERETGISTTVENDTNLAAAGEYAGGAAVGVENFIFVALGTGVGAGIFLRGALHHGANWTAGEIGYLPGAGASPCAIRMQETGQLERVIGGAGIEARWRDLLRRDPRCASTDRMHLRAPQIFDRAEQGDPLADEVVEATARVLADALSTVALLYNPQMIVLGGGVGSHPTLCRRTEHLLREHEFAVPAVRSSSLGSAAQLHGAVAIALNSVEPGLLC